MDVHTVFLLFSMQFLCYMSKIVCWYVWLRNKSCIRVLCALLCNKTLKRSEVWTRLKINLPIDVSPYIIGNLQEHGHSKTLSLLLMSRTQSCASDRGKKKWTASLSDHSVSLSFPPDPPDALCSALLASKIVIFVWLKI